MIEVAIIGAGELGGSLAHVLARRSIVGRIQLIDAAGQVAAGKALDIMQAGPVEGFTTPVSGTTDLSRVAGAHLVVVADPVRPQPGDDPLLRLTQLSQLASRAVVLCAGADGLAVVERGVAELGFSRTRLVGTAPEALASAVRALVALHVDGSTRDIALSVFGVPPSRVIVNWDDGSIAGFAATRVLDENARRRLSAQAAALWPPGPHALAHAATEAVAAMLGASRRTLTCFLAPDTSSGRRTRGAALPVRLGPAGVASVDTPTLSVAVRVALDNATLL